MECFNACFTQLWQVVWGWMWCIWSGYWSSFLGETSSNLFIENLNEARLKWTAYDKELYVVVRVLKIKECYLINKDFILHSNHSALKSLNSQRKSAWIWCPGGLHSFRSSVSLGEGLYKLIIFHSEILVLSVWRSCTLKMLIFRRHGRSVLMVELMEISNH